MNMGWVDIVIACAFIFGVFLGLRRGLTKMLPGFFEAVIAQTVAIEYSKASAEFINTGLKVVPVEFIHIAVFAVLAVCIIILVHFIFVFLMIVASVDFKAPFNNVGAALLGGIQAFLFAGLITYFLALFPIPFIQETLNTKSISGPYTIESNQFVHDFFIKWLPVSWRVIK